MLRAKNLLILLGFIIIATFISQPSNFLQEKIKTGEVSTKNIFSPKYYKYLDTDATNSLKQQKMDEVQAVYTQNNQGLTTTTSDFNDFINSVISAKKDLDSKQAEINAISNSANKASDFNSYKTSRIQQINNPFGFSASEMKMFLDLNFNDLDKMNEVFTKELEHLYDSKITVDNLDDMREQFRSNTNFYYFFPKDVTSAMVNKLSQEITPNFVLDDSQTKKQKDEAASKVSDIYKEIKRGELIISAGDVVTQDQINKLEALGMLKTNFDFVDILYQFPYFALIFVLIYIHCFHFYPTQFNSIRKFIFVFTSIILIMLITTFIKDSFFNFIPFLTALMVYMVFWGRKFVIFSCSMIGLIVFIGDFTNMALSIIAGLVLAISFSKDSKRMNLIISGTIVGFVLAISHSIVAFMIDKQLDYQSSISYIVSSCSAAIITVGLIPLIENMLGMVTSVRLHELSDQTHPLLRRLMREAVGTYTHSLMVANLAELAADEIGANGLLLKVGAYFHDVGKLRAPEYFIENSTPETNPHNFIDPHESAQIIRRHVLDSIKMCREFKLPEPVIDLIASHHGDAILSHLYEPAKEKDSNVNIEDFRYETPSPKTREEGILLLADSTEAYSRVLTGISKPEVKKKLKEMILKKVEHGILRDCQLTMKELDIIINLFSNFLINNNHERIPYKKDEI